MLNIPTFRKAMSQIMKSRMAFHDVTQSEMANAIGISQSQLSKILKADRAIDLEKFVMFCEYLGDDAAVLIAEGNRLTTRKTASANTISDGGAAGL